MEIEELGPYCLKEVLGKGGMGTVYRGVNKDTSEEVAVKVLAPFYAAHDGFRERFTAEIRSLERLRHPYIVTLFGYGEEAGILFYAMELVRGNSLQEELATGRKFTWREVCRLGADICAALKQAHDHGIIHRDIKPANLLIDQHDQVKLSDFGIAKLFGDTNVTVGGVLGTIDFMAPEQADGDQPTPKCDLYSMGAVLYTLLSGRPPFQGKTLADVLQKLRFDEPIQLSKLNSDIPEELESIVHRLLEKEPGNRIPTALALSKRLTSLLEDSGISADPNDKAPENIDDISVGLPASKEEDELSRKQTIVVDVADISPKALAERETQDAATAEAAHTGAPKRAFKKYVEVDEQSLDEVDESSESRLHWLLTWLVLLASLAGIVVFVTNSLKPPTADDLFSQISMAIESGDEMKMLGKLDDVNRFVARFPNDDRTLLMKGLSAELDEMRSVRSLEARLRRSSRSGQQQSPLEDRLLVAMKLEESDASAAALLYQALIDLFGDENDQQSDNDLQCLTLTRQRLKRIQSQQASTAEEFQGRIKRRLAHADELETTDTAAADRIRQAIVALYGHEPWAADLVEQAEIAIKNRSSNVKKETAKSKATNE